MVRSIQIATPPGFEISSHGTAEPVYLDKLRNASRDESLSKPLRREYEIQHYTQHKNWRRMQSRLATGISLLGGSQFWKSLCAALHDHSCECNGPRAKIEDVVCLCLGQLEDDASMYQLSLLMLLLEKLDINHEQCFVFDPCHSTEDCGFLQHLGFKILQEDSEAKICVNRMTLFYMPKGCYWLTENLIEANLDSLHLLAILGNSLSWVSESEHTNSFSGFFRTSRAPHVQKVLGMVKETHLPDTFFERVREHLAALVPRALTAFGNGPLNDLTSLDCTLTTFPFKRRWQNVTSPLLRLVSLSYGRKYRLSMK